MKLSKYITVSDRVFNYRDNVLDTLIRIEFLKGNKKRFDHGAELLESGNVHFVGVAENLLFYL